MNHTRLAKRIYTPSNRNLKCASASSSLPFVVTSKAKDLDFGPSTCFCNLVITMCLMVRQSSSAISTAPSRVQSHTLPPLAPCDHTTITPHHPTPLHGPTSPPRPLRPLHHIATPHPTYHPATTPAHTSPDNHTTPSHTTAYRTTPSCTTQPIPPVTTNTL